MRKFMRFPARSLWFHALLLPVAAFVLLTVFAPAANGALIQFYDFEPSPTAGFPSNLNFEMPPALSEEISDISSATLAYGLPANGYNVLPTGASGSLGSINIPAETALNMNNIVLERSSSGGQSNGNNLQFEPNNIQVDGTIVPEPATVAAGLLAVLGLCWFQRRQLIRALRFRRT
jgi:hypothetical protein